MHSQCQSLNPRSRTTLYVTLNFIILVAPLMVLAVQEPHNAPVHKSHDSKAAAILTTSSSPFSSSFSSITSTYTHFNSKETQFQSVTKINTFHDKPTPFQNRPLPHLESPAPSNQNHPLPQVPHESCRFFFNPKSINGLLLHSNHTIVFNCSTYTTGSGSASEHQYSNSNTNASRRQKSLADGSTQQQSKHGDRPIVPTHKHSNTADNSAVTGDTATDTQSGYVNITPSNNNDTYVTEDPSILSSPMPYYRHESSIATDGTALTANISKSSTQSQDNSGKYWTIPKSKRYLVLIKSNNGRIVKIFPQKPDIWTQHSRYALQYNQRDLRDEILMYIFLNENFNFTVEAMHIGYVTMSVTLLDTDSEQLVRSGQFNALAQSSYPLVTKRADKVADTVFDISAAVVAILISFGIGCVTDKESLKRQLKYPVSLLIGFLCQFLLMPVVSINHCTKSYIYVSIQPLYYMSYLRNNIIHLIIQIF